MTGTHWHSFLSCRENVLFTISYFHVEIEENQWKMSFKGSKVQKVMVQPINLIFRYLQNRSRVQVWLFENTHLRIEGHIGEFNKTGVSKFTELMKFSLFLVGFDEYMNLVLDDAEEYHTKKQTRRNLGRIMLKGDNITLIQNVNG